MLILKQEDYNKIVDHAKKGRASRQFSLAPGIAVTPFTGRYPLSV